MFLGPEVTRSLIRYNQPCRGHCRVNPMCHLARPRRPGMYRELSRLKPHHRNGALFQRPVLTRMPGCALRALGSQADTWAALSREVH